MKNRSYEDIRKDMKALHKKTYQKLTNPMTDTQKKAEKVGKEIKKMTIGEPIT